MSEQIRLMMKFMQTVMSCRKETISDKLKDLKAVTVQNLSENLHRKISIFLMYLSATIFSSVWLSVLFRISSVMIWICNNLKKKMRKNLLLSAANNLHFENRFTMRQTAFFAEQQMHLTYLLLLMHWIDASNLRIFKH